MPLIAGRPFAPSAPAGPLSWTLSGPPVYANKTQNLDPPVNSGGNQWFGAFEMAYDGTSMFSGDDDSGNTPRVVRYVLGTPWDITSQTSTQQANIDINPGTGFAEIWGVTFKRDGLRLYAHGTDGEVEAKFVEYPLSSPYDLSTIGSRTAIIQFDWDPSVFFPVGTYGLWIDSTGSKMFVIGGNKVCRVTMSTPWSIATGVFDQEYDPAIPGFLTDVHIDPTGKKIFMADFANGNIIEDSMSTALDLTTATSSGRLTYSKTEGSGASGICWKWDTGTKFWVTDQPFSGSSVYEYDVE